MNRHLVPGRGELLTVSAPRGVELNKGHGCLGMDIISKVVRCHGLDNLKKVRSVFEVQGVLFSTTLA